jgi:hypothetical protein
MNLSLAPKMHPMRTPSKNKCRNLLILRHFLYSGGDADSHINILNTCYYIILPIQFLKYTAKNTASHIAIEPKIHPLI